MLCAPAVVVPRRDGSYDAVGGREHGAARVLVVEEDLGRRERMGELLRAVTTSLERVGSHLLVVILEVKLKVRARTSLTSFSRLSFR